MSKVTLLKSLPRRKVLVRALQGWLPDARRKDAESHGAALTEYPQYLFGE
jgi:hypothetical protein